MPYTNIVYVKFKLELLSDIRFTDQLDDEEKLLYMGLLLLAGLTHNNIPDEPRFIQRHLNLTLSEAKITEKITKICSVFPKVVRKSHFINFKNFNALHNYIGKSLGLPKVSPIEENRREEKSIVNPKTVLLFFTDTYKQRFSKEYIINWGKEVKIFKELLTVLSENDIRGRIIEFFDTDSDFVKKAGFTVGVFKSQINKLGQKKDGIWGTEAKPHPCLSEPRSK